jgi:diguanylate cyclase (GGDEF)-like protein
MMARRLGTSYTRVTAVIVAVMIISAIGVGLAILKLRDDVIADAARNVQNIASILGEQTSFSVQSIDLVIDELAAQASRDGAMSPADYARRMSDIRIYRMLAERLSRLPQADVITITDASGNMVATTRSWPAPKINLADRDYFQHFKLNDSAALFISDPLENRVTGDWTVFFVKSLTAADGRFLGTINVGVRPEYFLRVVDVASSLRGQSILVLRKDGIVLLRQPDPVLPPGYRMTQGSTWYDIVRQGGGNYRSPGYIDTSPRQVAVRVLDHYPLVINVAIEENLALTTWRKRATVFGSVTIAIELAFAFLIYVLHLQHRRTAESEALLARRSEELHLSNLRFDAALSHMSHGIAMYDAEGHLLIHNRQYEQIWGMNPGELMPGTSVQNIIKLRVERGTYPGTTPVTYLHRHLRAREARYTEAQTLADGRTIFLTFDPMPGGGWVTTHEDITDREDAAAKIAHMAQHDGLTNLANRSLFMEKLQQFIERMPGRFAVHLIDLDLFKEVNDTFGHGVGDQLLCEAAARLKAALPEDAVVARLGGDEFAALHPLKEGGIAEAATLAEVLLRDVQAPYDLEGHNVTVGLCIGVAVPEAEESSEQIIRHADLALYRAKAEGRNRYRIFERAMEETVQSRRQLALDLQTAIATDGLQAFYQPILDARTLEFRTMETLLRWPHATRGMVPPPEFIALAEEAGLILRLGEWVLRRACRDALNWPESICVAVNVSAIQVTQSDLPALVARVLEETGLPASRLKLEITESVLLSDSSRALAVLHALRDLGLAIALDDFGTGYSSLSYLKMFPFDELKIDKSFIDDIVVHRGCAAIVSATTSLARAFDIVTTAEGVETREQFDLLRAAAVTQVQGYLFGRPAPASAWNFEGGAKFDLAV